MQTKRNAFTFTLLLFLGGGTLSPIIDEATHPFFSSPTVPAWLKDILRVTHSFRRAHMWSGESPIEQVDWVGNEEWLLRARSGLERLQVIAREHHDDISKRILDRNSFVNAYLVGLEDLITAAQVHCRKGEKGLYQELEQIAREGKESVHLDVIATFYPNKAEKVKDILRSGIRSSLCSHDTPLLKLYEQLLSRSELFI